MRSHATTNLLDQLTDDEPEVMTDKNAQPKFSRLRLRQSVLRELSWLFNSVPLGSCVDLEPYPEVRSSSVNYGIASQVGIEADALDPSILRWDILLALELFEPRFAPDSLQVSLIKGGVDGAHHFRIEAELLGAQQNPHMVVRAEHGGRSDGVRVAEMHRED